MSGGKKAPIDNRASDALFRAGMEDYRWSIANFSPMMGSIKGFTDEQVDVAMSRPENQGRDRDTVAKQVIHNNQQADFATRVNKARDVATTNMRGATAAAQRLQDTLGMPDMNAAQKRNQAHREAFSRVGEITRSENTMRRGLRDWDLARTQAAAGMGREIKGFGRDSLTAAADAANKRNEYNSKQTTGGAAGAILGGVSGFLTGAATGNPFAAVGMGLSGAYNGYY